MSSYGLGSWFGKLIRFAVLLAKKYIVPAATDFASSILQNWGSGKNFKKNVSEKPRTGARTLDEQLKSRQSGKDLKWSTNTALLISLYSGQE